MKEFPAEICPLLDHLELLGPNRDFVLLYNAMGDPVWAAGRESHALKESLDLLMGENVRTLFILPGEGSLSNPENKGPVVGLSRNRFENRSYSVLPTASVPFSFVTLVPVAGSFFLGLVSFTAIARNFIHASHPVMLTSDNEDRIIAFGDGLAARGGPASAHWLGMKVTEFFVFNRLPLEVPLRVDFNRGCETAEWHVGDAGDFPFAEARKGMACFSAMPEAMLLDNSKGNGVAFWQWLGRLKPGLDHFEFEAAFLAEPDHIPCVILGGLPMDGNPWPDNRGLSLSHGPGQSIRLKKSNNPVRSFPLPPMPADGLSVLRIVKTYDHYSFMVNQHCLGTFVDESMADPGQPDLLYLFLRPGERLRLVSFRLRWRPYGARERANDLPGLLARPRAFPEESCFSVTLRQGLASNQNFTHYYLDDVTSLDRKVRALESEKERLSQALMGEGEMVGQSPALAGVREAMAGVAASNLTVLIEGETGSGKEVLARSLHRQSRFSGGPFIKVDCSAIPQSLMESELFGFEKGAFTGAASARAGRFEQAQNGTLVLDEVSNLTLEVQAKLLNVLQDHVLQRIGGTKPVSLNIRVIALSNIPLAGLVQQGRFREDLFYRLNQYRFFLPPLRERRDDIPLLARHFLAEAAREHGKKAKAFDESAMKKLFDADWKGNIRELRNVVLRSVLFAKEPVLGAENVAIEATGKRAGAGEPSRVWRKCRFKRKELAGILKTHEGNLSEAARKTGVSRVTFYKLLKKHGLSLGKYRPLISRARS